MKTFRHDLRLVLLALFAGVVVMLPACNRRPQNERLQAKWNDKCKEAADLLAGATDVASARAAEPKLKRVLEEMDKINQQLDDSYDSENVPAGQRSGMTKRVAEGIADMERLNQETLRIAKDPALVAAFGDTWKKLPSVFMLEAAGAIPKTK